MTTYNAPPIITWSSVLEHDGGLEEAAATTRYQGPDRLLDDFNHLRDMRLGTAIAVEIQ